jgi:hypothetical protein
LFSTIEIPENYFKDQFGNYPETFQWLLMHSTIICFSMANHLSVLIYGKLSISKLTFKQEWRLRLHFFVRSGLIDSEPESHKWLSGFLYPLFSWFSGLTENRESFSSIN